MQMLKLRRLVCVLKSFVVPPSIKGGNVTTEVSALINSIIKLECETRGLPMPAITWYKGGGLQIIYFCCWEQYEQKQKGQEHGVASPDPW